MSGFADCIATTLGLLRMLLEGLRETGIVSVAIAVVFYAAWSYCLKRIAEKTRTRTGILIWIPFLQFVPLLRGAGMSPFWLPTLLVPLLNLVVWTRLWVRLSVARGTAAMWGFFMVFPLLSIVSFLYLGFSESSPPRQGQSDNG